MSMQQQTYHILELQVSKLVYTVGGLLVLPKANMISDLHHQTNGLHHQTNGLHWSCPFPIVLW
jgi:hypothetical protein